MWQNSFFEEFAAAVNPPPRKTRAAPGSSATKEKKERKVATRFPIYAMPCEGCPLSSYRRFPEAIGNLATARLIVLLERPSLGNATAADMAFLYGALKDIGVAPEEIAFIYALRCACHDKELKKDEIQRCGNYILRDLAASPATTVLCCSTTAIQYMFDANSLRTYRGRVVEFNKKQVVCCQSLDEIRKDPIQASLFQNDIKRLGQVLSGTYTKPEYKYLSLTDADEICEVLRHIRKTYTPDNPLGWDVETMWLESLKPYATDCYAEEFRIWHMAFAWEDFTAVGFPFDPDPELVKKYNLPTIHSHPQILDEVRQTLESCKIVEHTKFDARGIAGKYGIEVGLGLPLQQFEDLHATHYLINPEDLGGNALKQLTWEYTTEGGYEEGIGFKKDVQLYDWEKNIHYNCHDSDLTRRIKRQVQPKLVEMKQDTVYEVVLKPINCAVLHMELDGFQMDKEYMSLQQADRKAEMDAATAAFQASPEVAKMLAFCKDKCAKIEADQVMEKKDKKQLLEKYTFNTVQDIEVMNSSLVILMYEVCGIPVTKMTEDKDPSTDADILTQHSKKWPALKHALAYRKAQKLYGTYISPYLDGKWKEAKAKGRYLEETPHIKRDGKVHPTIKPTGTRTGRSSCEKPNGQNIKNEYSSKRPFISRFQDGLLLSADYSQAEIRIAAVQCKDPVLTRALQYDIHTLNLGVIEKIVAANAAKEALLGPEAQMTELAMDCKKKLGELYASQVRARVPEKEFEKELKFYEKIRRTIAKKFMFGPMYGQTEGGIIAQLVDEVGVSQKDAQRDAPVFLAALRNLYAQYFTWAQANVPEARQVNYVESIFGRRRPLNYAALLANTSKNDKEIAKQLGALDRKVTNTKVQGPASDLCLLAGVHLVELFKNRRLSPKTELRKKLIQDALDSKLYARCLEKELVTSDEFEEFIVKMVSGKALTRTVLPIHDNLISDCPNEEVVPAAIIVNAVMSNVPKYYIETNGVPFSADLEIGPNLGELKAFTP